MYYCALSLEVLQHTSHISCHLCDLVSFGVQFPELSLKTFGVQFPELSLKKIL